MMTLWSSYRQKTDPNIGPLGQVRPPLLNPPRLGRAPPVARQSTAMVVGRRTAREGAGDQLAEGIAGDRLPVHAHPHRDFARTHLGLAHGKAEGWFTDHRVTVVRLRLMLHTPSGLASSCPTDAMGGQCTRECSRARQRRGFQVTATTQEENSMIRTQPAGNTDASRSAEDQRPEEQAPRLAGERQGHARAWMPPPRVRDLGWLTWRRTCTPTAWDGLGGLGHFA